MQPSCKAQHRPPVRAACRRARPTVDKALVVSDDAWAAKQRQDWTAWLRAITDVDRTLVAHAEDSIDLIFCGDTLRTFELRPSDRYKPWRRRTLAQAFTE